METSGTIDYPLAERHLIAMNVQSKIDESAGKLLSLAGKIAMVTGAASGIGRGIAFRIAEVGAFVAVLDIDKTKGSETATEIKAQGDGASFLKCDVRSATDCRNAVESVMQEAGKLDILCNCAGIAIR